MKWRLITSRISNGQWPYLANALKWWLLALMTKWTSEMDSRNPMSLKRNENVKEHSLKMRTWMSLSIYWSIWTVWHFACSKQLSKWFVLAWNSFKISYNHHVLTTFKATVYHKHDYSLRMLVWHLVKLVAGKSLKSEKRCGIKPYGSYLIVYFTFNDQTVDKQRLKIYTLE